MSLFSARQLRLSQAIKTCSMFFICCSVLPSVVAQQNGENQAKYTDILPPSPAVANISNFSRPDVGLMTGTAQFHLPVTTLQSGEFGVPISINYSSNGVKVDETSSRVGMGMQLEAGGAITRSVAGKGPDEIAKYKAAPSTSDHYDRGLFLYIKSIATSSGGANQPDGEPDIFNFSFCGQSGKFMLDSNRNVVQLGKSNLKFITNFGDTTWTFKVMDANGNEFLFGGKNYTEKSKKLTTCAKTYSTSLSTAWFLRKITLFNGDVINFVYGNIVYEYDLGVNQTVNYSPVLTVVDRTDPPFWECPCPVYSNLLNTCVNYIQADTWFLKRVYAPNKYSVAFTYGARSDSGDKLLNGIVLSYDGAERQKYQIQYDSFNTPLYTPPIAHKNFEYQNRYFLTRINRVDSESGNSINLYRLSYNDPGSLPARMSFSQDAYGYYNGIPNNTLVPLPDYPIEQWQFPTATANRGIDTIKAKLGILTKIQYLTGGYDSITYQTNNFYDTRTVYPTTFLPINKQAIGTGSSSPVSVDAYFNVEFDQTVSFYVGCIRVAAGTAIPKHSGAQLQIYNTATSVLITSAGVDVDSIGYAWTFRLPVGSYKATTTGSGAMAEASTVVTYIPGPPVITTKNWPVGGARVGQIISKSYDGKLTGKRRFLYHDISSSNSSATENYKVIFNKDVNFTMFCTYEDDRLPPQTNFCGASKVCNYNSLFSNPLLALFNPAGNTVAYRTVLESYDDLNGNGMIEHKFVVAHDYPAEAILGNAVLGGPQTNGSVINNGKETETTWYTKTATGYSPVRKKQMFYNTTPTNYQEFLGLVANQLWTPCLEYSSGPVSDFESSAYEASRYVILCPWLKMDSSREVQYTAAGDILSSSTSYVYDPDVTLMPKITTTRDSKGNLQVSTSYYSGNASTIPGITSDQTTLLNSLKTNKNAIGKLIYQENTLNGVFAGNYRMTMQTAGANVFPKDVKQQVVSGVDASTFSMLSYDATGNILERTKNNGVVFSYVWDHNAMLPVAEVTGANVIDVGLANFETTYNGNWTKSGTITNTLSSTAPSGKYYGNFAAGAWLAKSGLTLTRTYIVSFWSKSGVTVSVTGSTNIVTRIGKDGWTLTTMKVTGFSTISVTSSTGGAIDEVRIHPETAKMVSYAHTPGVGVISVSDPNNVITYYEYDEFQRLSMVRDMDGKILKNNQYHYSTYTPGTIPNTY